MYSGVGAALPPGAVLDPAATLGWRMIHPGETPVQSQIPRANGAPAVTYHVSAATAAADDARRAAQIAALTPVQPPPTITPPAPPTPAVAAGIATPANPVSQGTTPTPSSYAATPTTTAPTVGAVSAGTAAAIQAQPVVLPGAAGPSGAAVTPASTTDGAAASGFSLASLGGSGSLPLILAVLALSFMLTHKGGSRVRRR